MGAIIRWSGRSDRAWRVCSTVWNVREISVREIVAQQAARLKELRIENEKGLQWAWRFVVVCCKYARWSISCSFSEVPPHAECFRHSPPPAQARHQVHRHANKCKSYLKSIVCSSTILYKLSELSKRFYMPFLVQRPNKACVYSVIMYPDATPTAMPPIYPILCQSQQT